MGRFPVALRDAGRGKVSAGATLPTNSRLAPRQSKLLNEGALTSTLYPCCHAYAFVVYIEALPLISSRIEALAAAYRPVSARPKKCHALAHPLDGIAETREPPRRHAFAGAFLPLLARLRRWRWYHALTNAGRSTRNWSTSPLLPVQGALLAARAVSHGGRTRAATITELPIGAG